MSPRASINDEDLIDRAVFDTLAKGGRGEASQRTVLEAWISGQTRIVATSSEPDLSRALNEVRDDLIRQLTDAKDQTEPRNKPSLRVTGGPER